MALEVAAPFSSGWSGSETLLACPPPTKCQANAEAPPMGFNAVLDELPVPVEIAIKA